MNFYHINAIVHTLAATLLALAEWQGMLAERDLSSDLEAEARRSKASALRLKLMFFLDFFRVLLLLLLATLIGSISGSSSSEVSSPLLLLLLLLQELLSLDLKGKKQQD